LRGVAEQMKDLNWRSAFRRAVIFTLIWLGIVYITSRIWPERFGIEVPEELPFLAINAVFFFFIFMVFSAFAERRRSRFAQQRDASKNKVAKEKPEEENGEGGHLKGKPNPNTSRKKARRRR